MASDRRWDQNEVGYSNSSDMYTFFKEEIGRLIKEDAHMLLSGRSERTGGLVLAQLCHRWGFEPTEKTHLMFKAIQAEKEKNAPINRGDTKALHL